MGLAKKNYTRKVIGTLVLVGVLSLGVFGTARATQAFFLDAGRTLIFDATVASADDDSLTVFTTGTDPIELAITNRTNFAGQLDPGELEPGDSVKIIARQQGGQLVARVIRLNEGVSGYGTSGDTVLVSNATVVAKGADTFTVRRNGVDATFHVNGSTRFFRTSFASLAVGQEVTVFGVDSGSSSSGFVARHVFRR
jgi:hypothetical protein